MGVDEARTVRDLKGHQAAVFPMVGDFGGRIIDTAGDGILAEFASVVNAIKCAVAVQSKMAERNVAIDPECRMQFRIGINIGDVIFDETRIFGDGINVAARLEGIADPGGICISSKVYDEISGRVDLTYLDIGEQQLKNIARPVRVYRVRLKQRLEDAGLDAKYFEWPPPSDSNRPPYRGLRPFEAENAGIFFGREGPIMEALERLRGMREGSRSRILVILGASGAGKSSFLRAGLLPRLARDDRNFMQLPIIRPERAAIFGETGLLFALERAFGAARIAIPLKTGTTLSPWRYGVGALAEPAGSMTLVSK
jgi:hypothetical protein